jgi:hypothetical protein
LVENWWDFERFVPAGSVEPEIRRKVPREFLYFDFFVAGGGGLGQFHEHIRIEHLNEFGLYKLVIVYTNDGFTKFLIWVDEDIIEV